MAIPTLPTFSAGEILTSAVMDDVSLLGNYQGLFHIKTQAVGNVAVPSVTVTNVFSSDFDNYKIVISGGSGSTGGATLNMTLGATTTGYQFGAIAMKFATASLDSLSSLGITSSWSRAGIANSLSMNGEIELFSPNLAKRTHYNGQYVQTVSNGNAVVSGGFLDDSTQYTAFTLTPASGTITGGIIRVYGYRNSL
jgi:hypothetical protein